MQFFMKKNDNRIECVGIFLIYNMIGPSGEYLMKMAQILFDYWPELYSGALKKSKIGLFGFK